MIVKDTLPVFKKSIEYPALTPQLCIIVDTEEEFDWNTFSPNSRSVTNIRFQEKLHNIYDIYGIIPTYAIDYAVASQEGGYRPLRELLMNNKCEIGAHLHPWVNPPITEEICVKNSYPCNLGTDLEHLKIQELTKIIHDRFEVSPLLYKAGRYGVGESTISSLERLGYLIDCSVLPGTDLRPQQGPNFADFSSDPYWIASTSIMEIPVTTGFPGILENHKATVYPWLRSPLGERLRLPSIFARLALLDRIRLTPEGITLQEAKRLTRHLTKERNVSLLTLTYHSSSLGIGNTPYVQNQSDLNKFISWIKDYLEFFFGEIGGTATTVGLLYQNAAILRARLNG